MTSVLQFYIGSLSRCRLVSLLLVVLFSNFTVHIFVLYKNASTQFWFTTTLYLFVDRSRGVIIGCMAFSTLTCGVAIDTLVSSNQSSVKGNLKSLGSKL